MLRDYKGARIGTSGIAEFEGNEEYRQSGQDLGIAIEREQQIALALARVSIADLRELRRAYPDAEWSTAIALSHRGISVGEAVALRQAQAAPMTAKEMLTAFLSRAR